MDLCLLSQYGVRRWFLKNRAPTWVQPITIVTELPHIEDPNILKVYLEVNHLDYHDQLFYDGDGWWRVRNYKSSEIRGWLQGAQWGMSISIAKCRYLGSEFA